MKKLSMLFFVLPLFSILFTCCESKAGTGALVGGGLGAGTGALIGGGKGALIGGAAGVVGGAIVGHLLDDSDKDRIKDENPSTMRRVDRGDYLTVEDVIVLHRSGLSDDKIIELIKKSKSTYKLSTRSIQKLERAGVSSKVIDFMLSSK